MACKDPRKQARKQVIDKVTYSPRRSLLTVSLLIAILTLFINTLHSQDMDTAYTLPDNFSEGPHIFVTDSGKVSVMFTASDGVFDQQSGIVSKDDLISCNLPEQNGSFSFRLMDVADAGPAEFDMTEKILAISDIEGNFGGFASILRSSGVIDSSYNWSFGKGHLVLLGDFFDRGKFVTECLWLIYKLEAEAETAGGKVHFILGNHEVMVMRNDLRYVHEKYKKIAELSGTSYDLWFSPDTELGSWLRKKNCIAKIGSTVFVHGGISPELLATGFSAEEINDKLRELIDKPYSNESQVIDSLIMRGNGPLWYRGIAKREVTGDEIDRMLKHYSADRITIGHSIFDNMSELYGGRVIAIDIDHAENFADGKMYALMIEGNVFRVIDLQGNMLELHKLQE